MISWSSWVIGIRMINGLRAAFDTNAVPFATLAEFKRYAQSRYSADPGYVQLRDKLRSARKAKVGKVGNKGQDADGDAVDNVPGQTSAQE